MGKEDILRTLNQIAIDHHTATQARLPKRQVEDVVETKRNQRSFDQTVDKSAKQSRIEHKTA